MLRWLFLIYRAAALSLWPHCCRFTPSCSEYLEKSIREKGAMKGSYLGLRRVLNCHPWGAAV